MSKKDYPQSHPTADRFLDKRDEALKREKALAREEVKDRLILEALKRLAKCKATHASTLKDKFLAVALQELEMQGVELLEECGGCGCYHPKWFSADCRDDANRFPSPYGDED
jgi:hypothetical protein